MMMTFNSPASSFFMCSLFRCLLFLFFLFSSVFFCVSRNHFILCVYVIRIHFSHVRMPRRTRRRHTLLSFSMLFHIRFAPSAVTSSYRLHQSRVYSAGLLRVSARAVNTNLQKQRAKCVLFEIRMGRMRMQT